MNHFEPAALINKLAKGFVTEDVAYSEIDYPAQAHPNLGCQSRHLLEMPVCTEDTVSWLIPNWEIVQLLHKGEVDRLDGVRYEHPVIPPHLLMQVIVCVVTAKEDEADLILLTSS
jgi:hypothetical protein